jgi:hypothetical protein
MKVYSFTFHLPSFLFHLLQSGRRGSNPQRPPWKGGILPLNYSRVTSDRWQVTCDKGTREGSHSCHMSLATCPLPWSGWAGSNCRPHRPKRCALPTAPHPAGERGIYDPAVKRGICDPAGPALPIVSIFQFP